MTPPTNERAYDLVVQVVANAYRSGVHDTTEGDAIADDARLLAWAADRLESVGVLPMAAHLEPL